jgi:hypothetical protein
MLANFLGEKTTFLIGEGDQKLEKRLDQEVT